MVSGSGVPAARHMQEPLPVVEKATLQDPLQAVFKQHSQPASSVGAITRFRLLRPSLKASAAWQAFPSVVASYHGAGIMGQKNLAFRVR